MSFINTIVEYEGVVVEVRPRYWAAHKAALAALGLAGPHEEEFWRLWRTGAAHGTFIHGRPHLVAEYLRVRDQHMDNTDLMALDQPQPGAGVNLRLLKQMGSCHLVTLCRNRDGINATLDRLDLWMHFDSKQVLPDDRDRRIEALRQLVGGHHSTLAIAGTVPFAYVAGEAGCRVVGMKNGPAVPKRLRQVGVDVFFDSLDELTDALAKRHPDLQRIGLV